MTQFKWRKKMVDNNEERPSYLPDGVHDDPENREFWKKRADNKKKLRKYALITVVVCVVAWLLQSL